MFPNLKHKSLCSCGHHHILQGIFLYILLSSSTCGLVLMQLGNRKWYKFGDNRVSPVSEEDIKTSAAHVLFCRGVTWTSSDKYLAQFLDKVKACIPIQRQLPLQHQETIVKYREGFAVQFLGGFSERKTRCKLIMNLSFTVYIHAHTGFLRNIHPFLCKS